MSRIVLTKELAHAAGTDAGNRSMRHAGRAKWNEDDWNAAAKVTNELLDRVESALRTAKTTTRS